jgi:sulfatase maturation enzyme AslB (radical SAM superfamily)
MVKIMKTRTFADKNYKSIFHNGKTLRIAIDPKKPIEELDYPEFYDVKITDKCGGKCPYCYQDSLPEKFHFADVLVNIRKYFGSMDENQKPFQVAIGGGNPNEHPDFIEILKEFYDMGIMPNYTTNGMGLDCRIIAATQRYCGGVAVSCHPHLEDVWKLATYKLWRNNIKVNLHVIISDKESIDKFMEVYEEFNNLVDYFVLLPYTAAGRAKDKGIDYDYLMERMKEIGSIDQIAFGANFYPYLMNDAKGMSLSLYEPEIMSKYLDMSDMKLYKSSFNLIEC